MANPLGQVRLEEMMTRRPEASMPARSILGLAPQSVQYMYLGKGREVLQAFQLLPSGDSVFPGLKGFYLQWLPQPLASVSSSLLGSELSLKVLHLISLPKTTMGLKCFLDWMG